MVMIGFNSGSPFRLRKTIDNLCIIYLVTFFGNENDQSIIVYYRGDILSGAYLRLIQGPMLKLQDSMAQ